MTDDRNPQSSAKPAKPAKLTVEFWEKPGEICVRAKGPRNLWPLYALSLIMWAPFWAFSILLVFADIRFISVFLAIIFSGGFLGLIGQLSWCLFGEETLWIDSERALFIRTANAVLLSRRIPRKEIKEFASCLYWEDIDQNQYLHGIEMVTTGRPLTFAFHASDQDREWLIERLNSFLVDKEQHSFG